MSNGAKAPLKKGDIKKYNLKKKKKI